MKKWIILIVTTIALTGCFRQEIRVEEYKVPELKKVAAAEYLQKQIKQQQGVKEANYDLNSQTFSVIYDSDETRIMNIEEAIAQLGFTANNRPANPQAKAKLPKEWFQTQTSPTPQL